LTTSAMFAPTATDVTSRCGQVAAYDPLIRTFNLKFYEVM